jgi:DNA-binding CsgD family transcriptional regulator
MKKPLRKVLVATANDQKLWASRLKALSVREREVMLLVVQGLPNKTIARRLKITEGTIKSHLNKIYDKLGVRGRFAITALIINSRDPREDPITKILNGSS